MANKPNISRKNKIIIVSIATILILGVGLGAWWLTGRDNQSDSETDLSSTGNESAITQDFLNEVEVLRSNNQHDEAQALIESSGDYKDGSLNTILYAQILADKGDVDAAVNLLSETGEDKSNEYWYKGHVANILSSVGRNSEAVVYYKEAIALAEGYSPSDDEDALNVATAIGDYKWYIEQIEAGSE